MYYAIEVIFYKYTNTTSILLYACLKCCKYILRITDLHQPWEMIVNYDIFITTCKMKLSIKFVQQNSNITNKK